MYKDVIIDIPKFIKKTRKAKKITQVDLAEIAGITPKALSDIEQGLADPKLKTVNQLLNALGYILAVETRIK